MLPPNFNEMGKEPPDGLSALQFAEAVNGRAAMYGTAFGSLNWGLTGLSISDQLQFSSFKTFAAGVCILSILSVINAREGTLSQEEYEKLVLRNPGRLAMVMITILYGIGLN